jgi:hypothetical protein
MSPPTQNKPGTLSPAEWEILREILNGAAHAIGTAITPHAAPGTDETGGTVTSLTEAVMGITAGLCRIAYAIDNAGLDRVAEAIDNLASAVRERGQSQ